MTVYGFQTQKGGEGKTTMAGNVGYEVSQLKKTVLVDADSQGSLTSWLFNPELWGHTEDLEYELYDVIMGKVAVDQTLLRLTDTLYLLPTAGGVGGELNEYKKQNRAMQNINIIIQINRELVKLGFDVALYDCSPSFDLHTQTVLASCDEVVAPMMPEFFSMDGLEQFFDGVASTNRSLDKNIVAKKLILNAYDARYDHHKKAVEDVKREWSDKLEIHVVPTDGNLRRCPWEHKPLAMYNRRSRSLPAIRDIAASLVVRAE